MKATYDVSYDNGHDELGIPESRLQVLDPSVDLHVQSAVAVQVGVGKALTLLRVSH